jgi:hypothetical protein
MNDASRPRGGGVRRELAPKRSFGTMVKRALLVWGLMAMVAGVAHWGFGRRSEAVLEGEVARYRRAGVRIEPADFVVPAPPDGENAAVDLMAAGELIDRQADDWVRFERLEPALPLDETELYVIESALDASRVALRRRVAAGGKPRGHW